MSDNKNESKSRHTKSGTKKSKSLEKRESESIIELKEPDSVGNQFEIGLYSISTKEDQSIRQGVDDKSSDSLTFLDVYEPSLSTSNLSFPQTKSPVINTNGQKIESIQDPSKSLNSTPIISESVQSIQTPNQRDLNPPIINNDSQPIGNIINPLENQSIINIAMWLLFVYLILVVIFQFLRFFD
ncbi:uncharacterized protein LOC128388687 [Panonychus citri]|uniref:uncharacterized protein LOC128388687 n=1 Tax=Panonychus citri TaxID=50023 RepID=UPI00230829D4|nr:uncharacterized protein LOC128388687 [Panonychus citri]